MANLGISDATRRAAECLLRSAGGRTVLLRVPVPPATPGVSEELGLGAPEFDDAELSPAVFRKARPQARKDGLRWELMVAASAVEQVLGQQAGATGASELFGGAAGVVVDGTLLEIESAGSSDAGGRPYVYRLVLRAPEEKRV